MNRILFFSQGSFSHINASVLGGLRQHFPAADIRCIDINALLKARPWMILTNIAAACVHYGSDILLRRRDLDDSFFSTKYIFEQVRRLALALHRRWPADCSFQTQSMFDCSSPGTPHFVYTDHTCESNREYPAYGRFIWAPPRRDWFIDLERRIYGNASCIFTMSQNVQRSLLETYGVPPGHVLCVRAGCNAAERTLSGLPLDLERYRSKRVLFVGREWERKGGPELWMAFRKAHEAHPDARLTVVGCKPNISASYVHVVPSAPLDEMATFYAEASVFCMPTKVEPFGIVFLEAMAAGLPVVALRLGAAPDFVLDDQTGILVEPGNIRGLASALIDLLGNPEKCRVLGANGRSLVVERYSWQDTCAAMAARMLDTVRDGRT